MASSSTEISPCIPDDLTDGGFPVELVLDGREFLPFAKDFIFRQDLPFLHRNSYSCGRCSIHFVDGDLRTTDSAFTLREIKQLPVLFDVRGTVSKLEIFPAGLPINPPIPIHIPLLTIRGRNDQGASWMENSDGSLAGYLQKTKRPFSSSVLYEVFNRDAKLRYRFEATSKNHGRTCTPFYEALERSQTGFFRRVWRRAEVGEGPSLRESMMAASLPPEGSTDDKLLLIATVAFFAFENSERETKSEATVLAAKTLFSKHFKTTAWRDK